MSLIVLIGLFLKIRLLSTENVAMNVKIISKIMHFSWPIVLLSTTYHLTSSDFSFSLAVFFFFVAPLRSYRPLKTDTGALNDRCQSFPHFIHTCCLFGLLGSILGSFRLLWHIGISVLSF